MIIQAKYTPAKARLFYNLYFELVPNCQILLKKLLSLMEFMILEWIWRFVPNCQLLRSIWISNLKHKLGFFGVRRTIYTLSSFQIARYFRRNYYLWWILDFLTEFMILDWIWRYVPYCQLLMSIWISNLKHKLVFFWSWEEY